MSKTIWGTELLAVALHHLAKPSFFKSGMWADGGIVMNKVRHTDFP